MTLMEEFGKKEIQTLADYYGSLSVTPYNIQSFPPLLDTATLVAKFRVFKQFVLTRKLKYESRKKSLLASANNDLTDANKQLKLLGSIYSKHKMDKKIYIKNCLRKMYRSWKNNNSTHLMLC